MNISGKQIVVLGAARSGLAAAELAKRHKAKVFVSDSAPDKNKRKAKNTLQRLRIPFEFNGHSDRVFASDLAVLSPGIPQTSEVVQQLKRRHIPVISEIELAYWYCKAPLVAVTGSNGKTTTTTILGKMLKTELPDAIVAGNIGQPFSAYVAKCRPDSWAAVEVSSFQLETIDRFYPRIAIILNLSPNHLDWYDTYEDYVAAKMRITKNMQPDDIIIYDRDDELLREKVIDHPARKICFSARTHRAEAFLKENSIYFYNKKFIDIDRIKLHGIHNYKNIMAAGLAALQVGIVKESLIKVVTSFAGVEHRLEPVATINGIHFINDSKATTIESLRVALQSFKTPIILIAGGKDKGADFTVLNELVQKAVRKVILIGTASEKIAQAWHGLVPVQIADTLENAVLLAFRKAYKGDQVLLSPACSSFDMFKDFEDRGTKFKKIVKQLKNRYED